MDNSSLLNFLSAVISALITTIGVVLAAYLSKRGEKKPDKIIGGIVLPPDYVPRHPPKNTRGKWFFFIILSLVILTIVIRLVLFLFVMETKTVPFASNNDPTALNPNLEWEAGSSNVDAYRVDDKFLVITAGAYTWPNFPMIHYKPIVEKNFSVSVKMTFVPDAPVLKTAQMAGILIHPINEHLTQGDEKFPSDWIAVSKNVTEAGSLVGCRGSWTDYYYSDPVFLKIERVNNSWRCAYSNNGENWSYLNISVNSTQLENLQFIVSLFAYSGTDNAIKVTFSDWVIEYEK